MAKRSVQQAIRRTSEPRSTPRMVQKLDLPEIGKCCNFENRDGGGPKRNTVSMSQAGRSNSFSMNSFYLRTSLPLTHRACPFRIMCPPIRLIILGRGRAGCSEIWWCASQDRDVRRRDGAEDAVLCAFFGNVNGPFLGRATANTILRLGRLSFAGRVSGAAGHACVSQMATVL